MASEESVVGQGVDLESSQDKPQETMFSRASEITREIWESYFDVDGRLVRESELRKGVFKGGILPELRKDVWKYLLGFYEFNTTNLEREIIRKELHIEYQSLVKCWKELLEPSESSNADSEYDEDPQMIFMRIQADLNARRHIINEAEAKSCMRVINKDVPRTDRKEAYFAGDDNIHLTWLRNILITYAIYHPDIGYAQGMNDLLSMILFVMDDEADAYKCFCGYMNAIRQDFGADGMVDQLQQLHHLLSNMDPELCDHLEAIEAGDLVFCHRWLLLSFKREFTFNDSLRLFEILCSHHLELSSIEADKMRHLERRKEKEKLMGDDTGKVGVADSDEQWRTQHQYRFGFFICLAILRVYRPSFTKCTDAATLFLATNSLVEKMNLDEILGMAERIFFQFCCKSVHATN